MGATLALQGFNHVSDQIKHNEASAYYANRRRGNLLILLALLAFVAFSIAVTITNFDSREFMSLTHEHDNHQKCLKALRKLTPNSTDQVNENINPLSEVCAGVEPHN